MGLSKFWCEGTLFGDFVAFFINKFFFNSTEGTHLSLPPAPYSPVCISKLLVGGTRVELLPGLDLPVNG